MAADWQVQRAKYLIGWPYLDTEPVRLALTAGDTESDDREGNRRLAQFGDRLIPFIITVMCYQLGVSRDNENATQVKINDKKECARRARICHLDTLIKASVRQKDKEPQPTVLKNTTYALIAAVWMQAQDWSMTTVAMMNLGLVCRSSDLISPYQLMTSRSALDISLLDAVIPYLPGVAEQVARIGAQAGADNASSISRKPQVHQPGSDAVLEESSDIISASAADTVPPVASQTQCFGTGSSASVYAHCGFMDAIECQWTGTAYGAYLWDDSTQFNAVQCSNGTMTFDDSTCMQIDAGAMQHAIHASLQPIPAVSDKSSITPLVNCTTGKQVTHDTYLIALSAFSLPDREALMQIVDCVGTPLAVFSLKLLVENLRDLELRGIGNRNARRIAAKWSSEERLGAINDLTLSLAHFILPLRMHIYMLYKDAEAEHPERLEPRNPFVMERGLPSMRGRGRPDNIRKASISQKMTTSRGRSSKAKRWRRVGQRLDQLVNVFGIGVLGLLDERLTFEIILKVIDPVFETFVAIIGQIEGDTIRDMCDKAAAIVRMLFDQGNSSYASTFHVEHCDENVFKDSERCSPLLSALLLPTT